MATLAGFLCLFFMGIDRAQAQRQQSVSLSANRLNLPQPTSDGSPKRQGFDAAIDLSDQFSAGYIKAEASFESTVGAWTVSRDLLIRFTPIERHVSASAAMAVEIPITLEQGETTATTVRWIPKWTIGNAYRTDILEDGVPLAGFSGETGVAIQGYATETPSLLMINDLALNVLMVDCQPIRLMADSQMQSVASTQPIIDRITLDALPRDWRGMREIDCIVINRRTLEQGLSAPEEPGPIDSLRSWLMMGGTLVVLEENDPEAIGERLQVSMLASQDTTQLFRSQVDLMLYEVSSAIRATSKTIDLINRTTPPPPTDQPGSMNSGIENEASNAIAPGSPDFLYRAAFDGDEPSLKESKLWLRQYERDLITLNRSWAKAQAREVGMGNVILIPGKSIDSNRAIQLLSKLLSSQISPMLKRGVDPIMGDGRFRLWLIPGVAEPPVYTFMGILTLFVLLVGPLAYRWTMRGHRSHLMFLIAPALAVITTVAMFSYSIISDGFGTKVRVRQVTWVDGASGDAVERTRSTLFAGISPREGIAFDASAEVMRYPNGGQQAWSELRTDIREVRLNTRIDDEYQRFQPSVLPSRTQTQFVSHRVRRGVGSMRLKPPPKFFASDPKTFTDETALTNDLSINLRQVVARSRDGRYWALESLNAGQSAQAKWIADTRASSKLLGKLYSEFRPSGGVGRAGRSSNREEIKDLQAWVNRQIVGGSGAVVDGLFESWLNQNLFIKGDIPPGTFVGLSDPSDDVISVQQAERLQSIRYVMGTLK